MGRDHAVLWRCLHSRAVGSRASHCPPRRPGRPSAGPTRTAANPPLAPQPRRQSCRGSRSQPAPTLGALGSRLPSSQALRILRTVLLLKGRSFALRQGGCLATTELFCRQPLGAAARLPFKPGRLAAQHRWSERARVLKTPYSPSLCRAQSS
ncbi:hypothetical protein NN561_011348 [Cricetulus griseus]